MLRLDTKACTCQQDGAAVAGLAVAGLALAAVEFTGQRIWDPIGSIVVGQLLGVVCINSDHLCPWFTDVEGSFICPLPYEKSPGLPQICLLNLSWGIIFHHVICLSLPVCFCGFYSHESECNQNHFLHLTCHAGGNFFDSTESTSFAWAVH